MRAPTSEATLIDDATSELLRERLVGELDALLGISPLALLVSVSVLLTLAWVIGFGGPAMIRTSWRLGIDPRRRFGPLSSGLRLLGLLVVLFALLGPVFRHAPTLSLMGTGVTVVIVAVALPALVRNLAAGLSLALRSRLREGELVSVGEIEGIVEDVGLLRVRLRIADGGRTYVPAADFDRLPVTVGSSRAAVPIRASVPGIAPDELARERLRRSLLLSPYRRAGTAVELKFSEGGTASAKIDTWAERALDEVGTHLRATLLHTSHAPTRGEPPAGQDPAQGGHA